MKSLDAGVVPSNMKENDVPSSRTVEKILKV